MPPKKGTKKPKPQLKPNPAPIKTAAGVVRALEKKPLAPGYVRIRSEVGRVVDIPAADLQDMLTQYPGVKIIAGANAGQYGVIQQILEKYDIDQIRTALDRLEESVPEWASADFMASKIVDQGGIGLLESMFPEGGRGLSFVDHQENMLDEGEYPPE